MREESWLHTHERTSLLVAFLVGLGLALGGGLWFAAPGPSLEGGGKAATASASDEPTDTHAIGEDVPDKTTAQDTNDAPREMAPLAALGGTGANRPQADVSRVQQDHPPVRRPIPESASAQQRSQLEAAMAAVEAQPYSADAWNTLGLVRKSVGDLEGAKEAWRYANRLMPSFVLPLVNIGSTLLLAEGKPDEAKRWFERARTQNPTYLFTYQQYADLFSGILGRHGEAEAFLRDGIARNPKSAALWLWLGEVLERMGGRGGDALYAFLQARSFAQEDLNASQEGTESHRIAAAIAAAADAGVRRLGGE